MSVEQAKTSVRRVPAHLREFVVEQHYDKYTPVDQAVWRYVLRQNSAFLKEKAHGSYEEGLRLTGMGIEQIPHVDAMNRTLAQIGWAVAAVDGFIPPVAFFDFQAHGFLPVAGDIRTLDHIAYTPAPDIIHESAGHAPMLAHEKYGQFLRVFGEIGAKAIASKEDLDVYEAIRTLSIVKEDPNATDAQVAAAEAELERALAANTVPSEATKISRLYWWTVEYGLIGTLEQPEIYGAGLLSSMGESRSLYEPETAKLPFDWRVCIATDFNITKPQPQLFVCRDFDELIAAVHEFAETMAYKIGGTRSLQQAVQSSAIATAEYASGLQVSGVFTDLVLDAQGEAIYLKTTGPSALAYQGTELPGHGKDYHAEGFGSPIGLVAGYDTPLEQFTDEQLAEVGLVVGQTTTLSFRSGVQVVGIVRELVRQQNRLALIVFDECTVTYGDDVLFRSEWGPYDMAVGAAIVSVFAGAADSEAFHAINFPPSTTQTMGHTYSEHTRHLHALYQQVRTLRETQAAASEICDVVRDVLAALRAEHPQDWLLRVEILELLVPQQLLLDEQQAVRAELAAIAASDAGKRLLIENGLALLYLQSA